MNQSLLHAQNELSLISIALCTYNGEQFLRQQIDSLLIQTYSNLEIVVVDDASEDNTKFILEQYALQDKRLRFIINENNIGFNKNFEKAIGLCTAQFIAICDQDDIWEANKIECIMNEWPEGSLFVYSLSGNFSGNDFKNRTEAPNVVYTNIDDVHKLVFNSPVHGHACMFKKELFSFCTPFPTDIFYDWWISMYAATIGTIGCVPHTLTWHRKHESNSSRSLTSIKEREKRNEQLRQQCAYFIETFCNRCTLQPQKNSLLHYASLLKQMDGKNFSWPMFRYVLKNRKKVFHYKKQKPFIFFSILKHAFRMGYKGLL